MNLTTLKIEKIIAGEQVTLFPALIRAGSSNYLIDCGYAETIDEMKLQLAAAGIQIEDLTGIIITHDDIDHLGGLKLLKQFNQNLTIYCGEIEKDAISGIVKSERLIQAEGSLDTLPEEHKCRARDFIQKLKNIQRVEVDEVLKDGQVFENELIVIHTPGHTRGHISLFYPKEKTLIAGDALVIENGTFNIANPEFTLDLSQAIRSVQKIQVLNPKKVICYHGGVMDENIEMHLENLINKFKNELMPGGIQW